MLLFYIMLLLLLCSNAQSIRIGSIANVSYVPTNSTVLRNISTNSCKQCLCTAAVQTWNFEAMNCFANSFCVFYANYSAVYTIQWTSNAIFYFFQLPLPTTTITSTSSVTTTTVSLAYSSSLWLLDNNTLDSLSHFDGMPVNAPTYIAPGITGYAYRNLTARSFTIEMWFYATNVTSYQYGLFGQYAVFGIDQGLHCTIRSQKLYFGFCNDDLPGSNVIQINTWYHVAFVFDNSSINKQIYSNGILDTSGTSSSYFRGQSGSITIGRGDLYPPAYFSGYIDQVSLVMRAKSASEILTDATLVTWHSFDDAPYSDSSSLGLLVTAKNITSVPGRVNQAISFSSNASFYQVTGFVLLGVSHNTFSMALWTSPLSIKGSVLVHSSTTADGKGWCLDLMGFSSIGQIVVTGWNGSAIVEIVGPVVPVSVWTHIAVTYSSVNGLRLYINGTYFNSSIIFTNVASDSVNILTLGNPLQGIQASSGGSCHSRSIIPNIYSGWIDEFRVYSRELNAGDVHALTNP